MVLFCFWLFVVSVLVLLVSFFCCFLFLFLFVFCRIWFVAFFVCLFVAFVVMGCLLLNKISNHQNYA